MRVVFYTKENCKLCDDAETLLSTLELVYPHHLEKRDIYRKEEWLENYHLVIPVIEVGGEQLHVEQITYDSVEKLLRKHREEE
jgi:glutaredoxin